MLFSFVTRSIGAITLTVTILVMGAVKGVAPAVSYALEQSTFDIRNECIQDTFNCEWILEIPKIELIADISSGTDEETMNTYIGHFVETDRLYGNVGLAAHNRGYPINYFKDLNKLEVGDKVYYSYSGFTREYQIDKIKVIKDTDWEPLKNTEENRITMITCIANKPEYRLCVQGIEIGGE